MSEWVWVGLGGLGKVWVGEGDRLHVKHSSPFYIVSLVSYYFRVGKLQNERKLVVGWLHSFTSHTNLNSILFELGTQACKGPD